MIRRSCCITLALLIGLLCNGAVAQNPPPDTTLDSEYDRRVVRATADILGRYYVDSPTATSLKKTLEDKIEAHRYDNISSALVLTETVNRDIREVVKDKHLNFGYTFEPTKDVDEDAPAQVEAARKEAAKINFGIRRVEILPGNVGYLDLSKFNRPDFSAASFASVFQILENTRGLIIDLRTNSGGDLYAPSFLCSYFAPSEPQLLFEGEFSFPDRHKHQIWTSAFVPGPRYSNRPVIVLTSKLTFSAAEAFATCAKRFGASIVGETTRGGASPARWFHLDPHFAIQVPVGKRVGSTWEGVGITPDIQVPEAEALARAKIVVWTAIEAQSTDPAEKDLMKSLIQGSGKD